MLRVENLKKSFGDFAAVSDANLHVGKGKIVAVIGPNGAGKSTLFKLITGHLKPDGGRVVFKGQEIGGVAPHDVCRRGLSLAFQIVNIFTRMSVFDNVQAAVLAQQGRAGNLFQRASRLAIDETMALLDSVGLAGKANRISGTLSHGDQKVLEMTIALSTKPELLILDEPTAGMSPEETTVCIDLVKRLRNELGLTILFCEHDMELVFAISDEIMVLRAGETLVQGPPEVVRENAAVQEAYLGGAGGH
ncbi:MAG: ABC transporter ATP-binding protein [Deltaproteobacteria bacterium]|nr:ABC transporter ATP-binding protein [Deltaproteobacteria bacterium]